MISKALETLRMLVLWGREEYFPSRSSPALPHDDRVLLMVTGFPPDISGGAYRPASLARYAKDNGWRLTAASFPAPECPSEAGLALSRYVGAQVEIVRSPVRLVEPSYKLLPRVDGSFAAAMDMAQAVRAKFKNDLPGTLVASGPSFCTFIAALFLIGRSSRKLVLEYRDEWTLSPFDFVERGGDNPSWERRCLARADLVIVTTASHLERLQAAYGDLVRDKCVVVPNGWEPELQDSSASKSSEMATTRPMAGTLTITFAGMLAEHTHPGAFLSTLAKLFEKRSDLVKRIQIRFVGKRRDVAAKSIDSFPYRECIELFDHVPLTIASRMMRESDAVLLIHNDSMQSYLPGKLYEYAASGVPILLVDDIGESRQIVSSLKLGYCINTDDVDALEAALDDLWRRRAENRQGHYPTRTPEVREWLERHTRRSLAEIFFRILSDDPRKA